MREEPICGGTTRNVDNNAPKEIKSDKMVFFKAETALVSIIEEIDDIKLDYICAHAVKLGGGTFLSLEYRITFEDTVCMWKYIADDVFPTLVKMVKDERLAKRNGVHSRTHGLPMNFGGEVRIEYDSGEIISFSNNQSSVFSRDFAAALYKLFKEKMQSESLPIPDEQRIVGIRFVEDGKYGYTRVELRKNCDGYEIESFNRYEDGDEYTSTRSVPGDMIVKLRETIRNKAVLLWNDFPERKFKPLSYKELTFVFDDGNEIVVSDNRDLPSQFSGAFFNIELALIR